MGKKKITNKDSSVKSDTTTESKSTHKFPALDSGRLLLLFLVVFGVLLVVMGYYLNIKDDDDQNEFMHAANVAAEAEILAQEGNIQAAAEILEKATQSNEFYREAETLHIDLTRYYLELEEYEKAYEQSKIALSYFEDLPPAQHMLDYADAAFEMGEFERARYGYNYVLNNPERFTNLDEETKEKSLTVISDYAKSQIELIDQEQSNGE